jgi:hypothetical protein
VMRQDLAGSSVVIVAQHFNPSVATQLWLVGTELPAASDFQPGCVCADVYPGAAESTVAPANGVYSGPEEYPVADFYDPALWVWSEESFEARQALQRYSEATHADY